MRGRMGAAALALVLAAVALAATSAFVTPGAPGTRRSDGVAGSVPTALPPVADADYGATEAVGQEHDFAALARWVGAGLIAGLVVAASSAPAEATANSAIKLDGKFFTIKNARHLDQCKDNKKYHKRYKDMLYKVSARQKKYPAGSVVYNRFVEKIASIKRREEAYGGRFCGKKDGIPRTIATGEFVRGGVVEPALIFLYTAGWIGWAGRTYLNRTRSVEKELYIDVPLALTCMASGFSWPVAAWQDIVNGKMVKRSEDMHRSFF